MVLLNVFGELVVILVSILESPSTISTYSKEGEGLIDGDKLGL